MITIRTITSPGKTLAYFTKPLFDLSYLSADGPTKEKAIGNLILKHGNKFEFDEEAIGRLLIENQNKIGLKIENG